MIATLLLMLAAQGDGFPPCDQAAADRGIQQDLNICAQHEYLEADEAMNAQWKITREHMKKLDAESDFPTWDERPGYFEKLLTAQRAWLAYRDAHCASEGYLARGGSMESMLVSFCKAGLTEERTEELRDLIVE